MGNNGNILQAQFRELGLKVNFAKEVKSPQLITYYFNLESIANYSVSFITRLIEKLSHYNHRKLNFVETYDFDFGVSEIISQRQPLFLTGFNFKANNGSNITIPIGKDLNNKLVEIDFDKIPHILIAGTTGSGKSVLMNDILCSLLATTHTSNFDMVLIDPKQVEFSQYAVLPNAKFIDETNEAVAYLYDLCQEMDARYSYMKAKGVSDSKGLLKPIYVFIDELADLMLLSRYEVEESITRLAQKGRACGIHLIVATQRPTANVLTGLIKANMPCKIALKVSSVRDSVVALDHKGAEQLLGFGDAIIKVPYSTEETRFQCAYVSKQKIQELIEMRKEN